MSTARNESAAPVPSARRATARTASFAVAPGSVAPVGRRVAAFALDLLVALVAVGIGYVVVAALAPPAGSPVLLLPLVLGIAVGVGQWIAEARTGATAGSAILGIRTLSGSTGRPAGLLAILVRQVVVGLGAIVCGVGEWVVVASGAWDHTPAQRGWHDKAAGTVVLRAQAVRRASARGESAPVAWSSAGPRHVEGARPSGERARGSGPGRDGAARSRADARRAGLGTDVGRPSAAGRGGPAARTGDRGRARRAPPQVTRRPLPR